MPATQSGACWEGVVWGQIAHDSDTPVIDQRELVRCCVADALRNGVIRDVEAAARQTVVAMVACLPELGRSP